MMTEQGEPSPKRFRHTVLADHLFDPEFIKVFETHWLNGSEVKSSNLELVSEPFRVCRISNFLKCEDFMEEVKNELLDVKSRRNSIDLYQYEQSNDLANTDTECIRILYETFQTDMVKWMSENTKIDLSGQISMSSSCYTDTDYLLCHDDNMGDRRIAFILYLSKGWTEKDGGALDLFDTDELGQPRRVVKSLYPVYNSLIFFEVTHNSFHQVAEVLSSDKSRWSINGWFLGPITSKEKPPKPEAILHYVESEPTSLDLYSWISHTYLDPEWVKQIQKSVEKDSYIFLANFLQNEVYNLLAEELQSDNIRWKWVGPANVRHYEVAEEDSLTEHLAKFHKLFQSISIFRLLKKYTDLDLIPQNETMHPKMNIEIQRWSSGCYTLITDAQVEEECEAAANEVTPASTSEGLARARVSNGAVQSVTARTVSAAVFDEAAPSEVVGTEEVADSAVFHVPETDVFEVVAQTALFDGEVDIPASDEVVEAAIVSGRATESVALNGVRSKAKCDRNGVGKPGMLASDRAPKRAANYDGAVPSCSRPLHERVREIPGCTTPPSSQSDDDYDGDDDGDDDDEDPVSRELKRKSTRSRRRKAILQKLSLQSPDFKTMIIDSDMDKDPSDVSDIGEYLSDSMSSDEEVKGRRSGSREPEDEPDAARPAPTRRARSEDKGERAAREDEEENEATVPGSLDVIMQFHTRNVHEAGTVDYVDVNERDGALIHVPHKDNHLCLVYKTVGVCRVHRYVNHYCSGYFYNLVCNYCE